MVALAVVSAALYAWTFSGAVAGGDAPESVAGVESIGILHAPGYPAYVLTARLFSWIVPIGDLAFRVNLFSAACAVGAVLALFLLARACGAPRAAAAFGSLVLATATSFWFYATYAKFYPLTSLLLISTVTLVVQWMQRGGQWRMVAAGLLLGLASGASYQVSVLVIPGLVVGMALSRRPERWRALGIGIGASAAASVVLWGFVYVRAGQHPAVNWGGASTPDRLFELMSMRDFGWGAAAFSSVGGKSARLNLSDIGSVPEQLSRYAVLLSRELSVALLVLAAIGAWRSRALLPKAVAWMLWSVFLVNVFGALIAVGVWVAPGFVTGLRFGGFILAATFVAALWAGIGAWSLFETARGYLRRRAEGGPRRERAERLAGADRRALALLSLGAALVLIPQVVVHGPVAEQPGPAVASYVRDVLHTVDEGGVLLVWAPDDAFPLTYGQVVEGIRPDVDLVTLGALSAPWYVGQVEHRLDVDLRPSNDPLDAARSVMEAVGDRPVFLEPHAWSELSEDLRTQPSGLIAEVVPGEPEILPPDSDEQSELLHNTFDHSALLEVGHVWPYESMANAYATAHMGLARAYAAENRAADVRNELEIVLALHPGDETALKALAALDEATG